MDKFKNIDDFKVGQVFVTKKGHKMEITDVKKDNTDSDVVMGSVEVKTFSHSESQSCKAYGWNHNLKWFKGYMRLDGKVGILNKIDKGGWTLKLEKNEK